MPGKTTKSSTAAKARGKGSQGDSDEEMPPVPRKDPRSEDQDPPLTNGKKQRTVNGETLPEQRLSFFQHKICCLTYSYVSFIIEIIYF